MSDNINQNYFFIHNIFAHFFDDSLNYFADYLYPRFHHQVVGTYDKAVEFINKKNQYGNEHDMPNLPAIILNPSGEFRISDAISGAQQLWRFPNISDGNSSLKARLYDPIYQDSNVSIYPIFTRIKGEFELIMLLNSFYEYCDMKLYMYQIFGGEGRPIYPSTFRTFLIIPEEMLSYEYKNDVTGTNYFLNWESAGAFETLVKTTNRNEIAVPVSITPRYTLTGMSDGSMKFGGTDKLADWRLNVNVEYEIEMPWYIYLHSDYLVENVDFYFNVLSYMGDSSKVIKDANTLDDFMQQFRWPDEFEKIDISYDSGLKEGEHGKPDPIKEIIESKECKLSDWKKAGFFYYTFTQQDIDNLNAGNPTDGFIIEFKKDSKSIFHIISKYGQLTENLDYVLSDINSKDTLIQIINTPDSVGVWSVDDLLEIYIFLQQDCIEV